MKNSLLQNQQKKSISSMIQRRKEMNTHKMTRKLEVYLVTLVGNPNQRMLIQDSYAKFQVKFNNGFFPATIPSIDVMSGEALYEPIKNRIESHEDTIFVFYVPSEVFHYGDISYLQPEHDRVHVIPVSSEIDELLKEGEAILNELNLETA